MMNTATKQKKRNLIKTLDKTWSIAAVSYKGTVPELTREALQIDFSNEKVNK